MFKKFLPSQILSYNNNIINHLVILLIIVCLIGFIFALIISPPDYIQGESVRIMYVHVPSSFIALVSFGLLSAGAIFNLIFKIKTRYIFNMAGFFFNTLK